MAFSQLPATLTTLFVAFTAHLDAHHAHLVCQLFLAGYFARGRRTVTSWFRVAGITLDFRFLGLLDGSVAAIRWRHGTGLSLREIFTPVP